MRLRHDRNGFLCSVGRTSRSTGCLVIAKRLDAVALDSLFTDELQERRYVAVEIFLNFLAMMMRTV
jgi:hypothetical protein